MTRPDVRAPDPQFDMLVVGGGINGAGIARDAAGRGFSVLLCEQHDLAAHTSSASTKLIHGGLRYLEFYQFGLVRKALQEREVLLAAAPHIMYPLRFVMPHDAGLRPAWMIRIGLFLYDHLARRRLLGGSSGVDLATHPAGAALAPRYRRGFVYSDGWVDDARLVVLNALDAAERGATVQTRTRCVQLRPAGDGWLATLRDAAGVEHRIRARAIVNATGPWAASFLDDAAPGRSKHELRLVKGSHIIVPRLFEHEFAYIFQAPDRRIVFAIPYEREFTLIGTTDTDHRGPPGEVRIDADEIAYLCGLASRYFRRQVGPADVVATYAGVRPLLDDESNDARSTTRDYALELVSAPAPLLTVFGGKITTYRVLAQEAVDRLASLLATPAPRWTAGATLPGGDLPGQDFGGFETALARRFPWLPPDLRHRYARAYGTRIERLLEGAARLEDLGAEVVPQLYERELDYLRRVEWARSADDVLWRRSKLGLHLPPPAAAAVQHWFDSRPDEPPVRPRACGESAGVSMDVLRVRPTLEPASSMPREGHAVTDTPATPALDRAPFAELAAALGEPHVSTALAERVLHSCDVFPWDDVTLPAAVVRPASATEVAAVVRIARRHGLAVAPRGGGVSYTRGYVPARAATLSLDLSRMNAIHDLNAGDLHVTVGPGVTWQQLDAAAAPHGLRPALRGPISGSHATIGGSVSQNVGASSMAGVLALEVVLADGRIVRTGSSGIAATPAPFLRHVGPDLTGLFVGDTGAFGIKTACTLALEPVPAGAAFASIAFDTLAQISAAMVAVARSGIPCRVLGMDPVRNRSATRGVGLREGLGTLAGVVKSASSVGAGLRQAAGIAAAGRGVLDDVPWSMHVTVEGHDMTAAARALDALRGCWTGAREIPPSVPTAMRARPYSIRGIVGIAGERWVPVHAIFPLSRAAEVVARVEAFMAAQAARLQALEIEVSYIVMTSDRSWLIEPMFYWPDELGPLHERVLGEKFAKFSGAAANPAARALVRELRGELTRLFDALGGMHAQLGKYYAYGERLQPDTWAALTDLKSALDPQRMLNPGNLGWD